MSQINSQAGPPPDCPNCHGPMEWVVPAKGLGAQWPPHWRCKMFPACEGRRFPRKIEDDQTDIQAGPAPRDH